MADVHSKEVRSFNMSRIKGRDTKPEMLVRRFLFLNGLRYRLHVKHLPGKPDIVLPKHKIVIFVHGCFWHGHDGCKYFVIPKTRTDWWLNKIHRNRTVDRKNQRLLTQDGWRVLTVYECELRTGLKEKSLKRILKIIKIGNSDH